MAKYPTFKQFKAALTRFDNAAQDMALKGSFHPDEWKPTEDRYRRSREKVESLFERAAVTTTVVSNSNVHPQDALTEIARLVDNWRNEIASAGMPASGLTLNAIRGLAGTPIIQVEPGTEIEKDGIKFVVDDTHAVIRDGTIYVTRSTWDALINKASVR
ncbi:hypothetical protein [Bosea vestrisii]|uniref:Uncharacterized protein n=1 Tax=Bosea vestrisii TaxID=151416 RepID=A0ABW0H823_9HYPH